MTNEAMRVSKSMAPLLITAAGTSASSMAMFVGGSLAKLTTLDVIVIAVYFAMVLWIGFYLKQQANTSEEFFMAGREMTAWIAGLSFVSANLGSLELMGWAGSAYQYGILAAHWYWIGAIPAMLFLGLIMMPFYYVSKTHSVPGYLKLRFGESSRVLAAVSFAFMTILMSGVNMFAMAVVMKVVLGWDITFSIFVSSIAVAVYVTLGGLRSAIFNEVLQFVLIWAGALLVPILGMIQAGGWHNLQTKILANWHGQDYTHMWRGMGHFADNPMGIHWTGIVFGLGFVIVVRILDNGFPGGSAGTRGEQPALSTDGADHRVRLQDGRSVHRDSSRPARPGPVAESRWKPDAAGGRERGERGQSTQLQRSAAIVDGPILRSRPAGTGHYRADCGLYVGNGRQRERLLRGVDV